MQRRLQPPSLAFSAGSVLAVLAVVPWLAGCGGFSRETGAHARIRIQDIRKELESERTMREDLQKAHAGLQQQHQRLKKSLTLQAAAGRDLDEELAKLHLHLLEKEAQVDELNSRLGEAILEVVRAKAKLRSLESKAEAASNLAEAEIALKALRAKSAEVARDRRYLRAEELLGLGAKEFKNQNFGGALYLSGQAKGWIREAREQSISRRDLPLLPGEIPFTVPVRLRAESTSNLREQPTLSSNVVAKLQAGDPLVGHSYKGKWVRVQDGSGRIGWVFYELVAAR